MSTNLPPLGPSAVPPPTASPRDVVVEGERHVSEVASAPRVSRRVQTGALIAGGALLIGVILLTSPSSTTRKVDVATTPTVAVASRFEPPPLPQQPIVMPEIAPTQPTAPPMPLQPYAVAAPARAAAQPRAQAPVGSSGLLVYTSGGSAPGGRGGQIVPSIADDPGDRGSSAQAQGAEGNGKGTAPGAAQAGFVPPATEPGSLGTRLTPTRLTGVSANIIAHPSYTLTMGSLLPCILQTAMDSSLPGLVTCVVPQDILGKTGLTLLDRGTRIVGEFRGGVTQGVERLFVVWTRAETPQGVVINIDSPASDPLGRSGLDGLVDHHFWQRFGGALLLTTVNGAIQAGTASLSKQGTTSINTGATDTVIASTLSGSLNIPPTIRKNQGELVSIFVARDLDFSTVYSVRPTGVASMSVGGRQSVSTAGLP